MILEARLQLGTLHIHPTGPFVVLVEDGQPAVVECRHREPGALFYCGNCRPLTAEELLELEQKLEHGLRWVRRHRTAGP